MNCNMETVNSPVLQPYHPVRRWFARLTDYALVTLLINFTVVCILRIRPISNLLSGFISWLSVFVSVPITAWMLHFFGTTPGKWLYGLCIWSKNGGKLSLTDALYREWNVLSSGMGYQIPLWSLWRLWKSYQDYREGEIEWDQQSEYQYMPWRSGRKLILALTVVAVITTNLFIAADIFSPKYLGDLTIDEFAENYNYYSNLLAGENDRPRKMTENGAWMEDPVGHVTVYATAQPTYPKQTFEYQLSSNQLRKISYTNQWTDIIWYSPLEKECERAAVTAVMSQKGTGLADLIKITKLLNDTQFDTDGSITYNNVTISWQIKSDNCQFANGKYFTRIDDTKESFVSVSFHIEIQ